MTRLYRGKDLGLVRENAQLRKRIRTMAYGRNAPRDTRMTAKAFDGGAALSEDEIEVLHRLQREGML